MRLFTSRYSNQAGIIRSGAVPVGITLGRPKFPLKYEPVYLRQLAPDGSMFHLNEREEFEPKYRQKLDRIGIHEIRETLREISRQNGGRDLVLLCYENVTKPGEWCHRQVFADWFREQTGEVVEELEESRHEQIDRPSQGTLF